MRMLEDNIITKLENINELPSIPVVLSEILQMLSSDDVKSKELAETIEKDQMLTTKVLRVANSPFYGFTRKISTIELAIALVGLNTIKEIVTSLMVKKVFINNGSDLFDLSSYWKYSVFSAIATKYFAEKMNYKPLGEAFVTGLMHDIGVVIIQNYFEEEFREIFAILEENPEYSLIEAEQKVLNRNHAEIASWLADKWNFPKKMCDAIKNHHYHFSNIKGVDIINDQPLTTALSLSEYFADRMGLMEWNIASKPSKIFVGDEIFNDQGDDLMDKESSISKIKQELIIEYEKLDFLKDF